MGRVHELGPPFVLPAWKAMMCLKAKYSERVVGVSPKPGFGQPCSAHDHPPLSSTFTACGDGYFIE